MTATANGTGARAATGFLDALFSLAPADLFFYLWVVPGKASYWFRCDDVGGAVELLPRFGAANVYVGCSLSRGDRGPKQRVAAGEAAGIVGLWADVDVKGEAHKGDDLPPDLGA